MDIHCVQICFNPYLSLNENITRRYEFKTGALLGEDREFIGDYNVKSPLAYNLVSRMTFVCRNVSNPAIVLIYYFAITAIPLVLPV
jgi:hypothetical protein